MCGQCQAVTEVSARCRRERLQCYSSEHRRCEAVIRSFRLLGTCKPPTTLHAMHAISEQHLDWASGMHRLPARTPLRACTRHFECKNTKTNSAERKNTCRTCALAYDRVLPCSSQHNTPRHDAPGWYLKCRTRTMRLNRPHDRIHRVGIVKGNGSW